MDGVYQENLYQYDPLRRMLLSQTGNEWMVEDDDAAEWLRQRTLDPNPMEIGLFGELAGFLNRVPTVPEYESHRPMQFTDDRSLAEHLLVSRMGFTGEQFEFINELVTDPERLYQLAETKLAIKVTQNKAAINIV